MSLRLRVGRDEFGRCGFSSSGHPELARMIAASEIGNLAFLVTAQGAPFTESRMATPRKALVNINRLRKN
jgi:hypothetical protein